MTVNNNTHLIRCGDEGLAPWAITCVHICDGSASEIVPVPLEEGTEVESDWLCRECYEKHFGVDGGGAGIDELRAVCIHCLRQLLTAYDS